MKMRDSEPIEYEKLSDMKQLIRGFLNNKVTSKAEDKNSTTKYEKEIDKLKKEVKKWRNSRNKLSKENKELKAKIKEHEEYYDRFDILDFEDKK